MAYLRITGLLRSIYVIVLFCLSFCDSKKEYLIIKPENITVKKGERIQANCTVSDRNRPFSLRWQINGSIHPLGAQVHFKEINRLTQALFINNAQVANSGKYLCVLTDAHGEVSLKFLNILVQDDEKRLQRKSSSASLIDGSLCDHPHFICDEKEKVFCRYRCNGQVDCTNGADEKGCPPLICAGKFRCNNSRCIDYRYVCDKKGENHCGDWSDEEKCDPAATTEINAKDSSAEDQMSWLKTTVYTVIACTVGVVLFISILVIAIFRIKMKRAAFRRAMRQQERRRRHGHQCESGASGNSQRNTAVEHEPFISAPSPTHYGNLIVNVNNGVQFVPSSDLNAFLQAPPSYSEVLAENRIYATRHSPPPEYSTIDRNPNQLPDNEQQQFDNVEPHRSEGSRSGPNSQLHSPADNRSLQLNFSGRGENSVSMNFSGERVASPGSVSAVLGTNSLGRQNIGSSSGTGTRQCRNVRAVGSPRRPKQLHVRDGQILLDGNSSNSSSPETMTRNTQTYPADINTSNPSGAKPGQLQVQGGQIILSAQNEGAEVSVTEGASSAQSQGQLEVKDGQIVFKAS